MSKLTRIDQWNLSHDKMWLGGGFWANPMEDWLVEDGWAACQTSSADRNIHSLLYEISDSSKPFALSTEIQFPEKNVYKGGAGFRLGITTDINDHRARCFSKSGLNIGIDGRLLFIGKKNLELKGEVPAHVEITLIGKPVGGQMELSLSASNPVDGVQLGMLTNSVEAESLLGNFAVVSHFPSDGDKSANRPGKMDKDGCKFRNWQISGDAFSYHPERQFGPILWSMYSLSDNRNADGHVMKITALTGPMGVEDTQEVELEIEKDGVWQKAGEARLDSDAWTATIRITNWDAKVLTPYRLVYREKHSDGSEKPYLWEGAILADPAGKELRIGALTCQNAMGFPYQPVADNLVKLKCDMLYFSGDQLYEQHGGYGIIRSPAIPAIHNYLRKFYMFGWAFRDAMRNAPTICLPDDHDVFHGNIWGEGGAPINKEVKGPSAGGYMQPARMINAVHRTNCSHHPDFASPVPCKQDISVYYGDMLYGGVNFGIIADRQWKSGPEKSGNKGGGRIDHISKSDYDATTLDKPGLELLGERQEQYIEKWAKDWRKHDMKVLLTQTVFAGVATHHGSPRGYLKCDLDSGGWPQTPRNRAIDLIRESMALHINGDQHLTSLTQYGVEKQRDSNWSFCTPAISVGYPRWWKADALKMPYENRPAHGLADTGEYLDGFGNKIFVYTIGNPMDNPRKVSKNRYEMAHNKGSGFGVVTIDTEKKTYTMECYRFLIDATDGKPDNQFSGWPVTIHQEENRGENLLK